MSGLDGLLPKAVFELNSGGIRLAYMRLDLNKLFHIFLNDYELPLLRRSKGCIKAGGRCSKASKFKSDQTKLNRKTRGLSINDIRLGEGLWGQIFILDF